MHQGKELHGPFPPCCVERTGDPWTGPVDLCSLQTSNLGENRGDRARPLETPVKSLSQDQETPRGQGVEDVSLQVDPNHPPQVSLRPGLRVCSWRPQVMSATPGSPPGLLG